MIWFERSWTVETLLNRTDFGLASNIIFVSLLTKMTRVLPPASCRIRVESFVENATPAGTQWAIIIPRPDGGARRSFAPLYIAPRPFHSSFPCFPPLSTFSLWIAPQNLHVVIPFPCLASALYSLVSYLGNPSCFFCQKLIYPY